MSKFQHPFMSVAETIKWLSKNEVIEGNKRGGESLSAEKECYLCYYCLFQINNQYWHPFQEWPWPVSQSLENERGSYGTSSFHKMTGMMKLQHSLVILLLTSLTCEFHVYNTIYVLLQSIVFFSSTGHGRVIVKRQVPGADFLNQIMQLFNFSSDNGPGHLLTNMFMQFMNQTTSVFAPFLGMTGGDPLALFNNIMQQFMGVFAQVTGLWSNTVSRQMDTWSTSVPVSDALEYQVMNKSIRDMHRIQENVELLSTFASERNEKRFIEVLDETRSFMDNLWRCFDVEGLSDINLKLRIDSSKGMTPDDYHRSMVSLQEEILSLWRMLSDRIVYDMRHPGGPHVYGHCPGSPTTTTTESSDSLSSPSQPSSSSTSSSRSGIEFDES